MINKIKSTFINKQFLKFGLIGVINTINHNIIYLVMLTTTTYLLANSIAFVGSLIISFYLNTYITFRTKPTVSKAIKYPLAYLPTLIIQLFSIVIVVETLGISEKYAGFIASLAAVPITFIVMKYIFKDDRNK